MGDDDDGDAERFVDLLEQRENGARGGRVEGARGLIAQQDFRIGRKRTRDRDTLLLAAGKLCRVAVHEHPDLYDPGDSADGFIDLLFCEFSLLGEDFSAGYDRIFVIQGLSFCFIGFSDPVQFLFQLLRLRLRSRIRIRCILDPVSVEDFCCIDRENERVDKLQIYLIRVEFSALIAALFHELFDLLSAL